MTKTLVGYADRFSAFPGDKLRFFVSSFGPDRYKAELVRLIGDDGKERVVANPVNRDYPGRRQEIHSGSYAVVEDAKPLAALESFSLGALCLADHARAQPTGASRQRRSRNRHRLRPRPRGGRHGAARDRRRRRRQGLGRHRPAAAGARMVLARGELRCRRRPRLARAAADRELRPGRRPLDRRFAGRARGFGRRQRQAAHHGGVPHGRAGRPGEAGRALQRQARGAADPCERARRGRARAVPGRSPGGRVPRRARRRLGLRARHSDHADPRPLRPQARWPGRESAEPRHEGPQLGRDAARLEQDARVLRRHPFPRRTISTTPAGRRISSSRSRPICKAASMRCGSPRARRSIGSRSSCGAPRGKTTADALFLVPTASYMAYANEHMGYDAALGEQVRGPCRGARRRGAVPQRAPRIRLFLLRRARATAAAPCISSRLRPILNMRPGHTAGWVGPAGTSPWQFPADLDIIDWLEATGHRYDVSTDEDLHREGLGLLERYRAVMTGSHPEYYSTAMHDAMGAWLERGGRLMYLGANGFYWRIAFHRELAGRDRAAPHRGRDARLGDRARRIFRGLQRRVWRALAPLGPAAAVAGRHRLRRPGLRRLLLLPPPARQLRPARGLHLRGRRQGRDHRRFRAASAAARRGWSSTRSIAISARRRTRWSSRPRRTTPTSISWCRRRCSRPCRRSPASIAPPCAPT